MDWFYEKNGRQEGPVSEEQLRAQIGSNELSPTNLVWREGMDGWKPAGELAELNPAAGSTGPNLSSPSPAPEASSGSTVDPSSTDPAPPLAHGESQPSPYAAPAQSHSQNEPLQSYVVPPPPTSGLAIASMICGIVSIFLCLFWALAGIPAVVLGHMAFSNFRNATGPVEGRGMAIAGLVLGYVALALQALFLLSLVFG